MCVQRVPKKYNHPQRTPLPQMDLVWITGHEYVGRQHPHGSYVKWLTAQERTTFISRYSCMKWLSETMSIFNKKNHFPWDLASIYIFCYHQSPDSWGHVETHCMKRLIKLAVWIMTLMYNKSWELEILTQKTCVGIAFTSSNYFSYDHE